jgi:hypothetical protein
VVEAGNQDGFAATGASHSIVLLRANSLRT